MQTSYNRGVERRRRPREKNLHGPSAVSLRLISERVESKLWVYVRAPVNLIIRPPPLLVDHALHFLNRTTDPWFLK